MPTDLDRFSAIRKGLLEYLVLKIVAGDKVYAADILAEAGRHRVRHAGGDALPAPLQAAARRPARLPVGRVGGRAAAEVSVRTGSRDASLVGIANGGTSRSVNEDDGNLNYDKNKPFANIAKATSDVELKYGRFGFFGRGTALLRLRPTPAATSSAPRPAIASARTCVGLDGFVSAAFEPGGKNLRLRAGRQVISWGESTFIPNGINVINPVDLSEAARPGLGAEGGVHPHVRASGPTWSSRRTRAWRASTSPTTTRSASTRAAPTSRTTTSPPTTRRA